MTHNSLFFLQILALRSLQGLLGRLPEEERKNVCSPKTLFCEAKHNECKGADQGWPRHQLLCIVIVTTDQQMHTNVQTKSLSNVFRCVHFLCGCLCDLFIDNPLLKLPPRNPPESTRIPSRIPPRSSVETLMSKPSNLSSRTMIYNDVFELVQ